MDRYERLKTLLDQGTAWYGQIADALTALSPSELDTVAMKAEHIARFVRAEQQRRAGRGQDPTARLYRQRGG